MSGLQYNRARWYDPAKGRWLSQDPIGFAAGDANLYRYVGNKVTTHADPSGNNEEFPGIPEKGGIWTNGRPGHGIWWPDSVPGTGIPYRNGQPNFARWIYTNNGKSPGAVNILLDSRLNASDDARRKADYDAADRAYKKKYKCPDWERPRGYTWHHQSVNSAGRGQMLLVRSDVHAAAKHYGPYSLWRNLQKAIDAGDSSLISELLEKAKRLKSIRVAAGAAGGVIFIFLSGPKVYGAYQGGGISSGAYVAGREVMNADSVEFVMMVPARLVDDSLMLSSEQGKKYRLMRSPYKHGVDPHGLGNELFPGAWDCDD